MSIFELNQVVPIPLKDQTRSSDIWAQNYTLEVGQRYFVAAPSGSGKTTFQHILYGLRQDYQGTVRIHTKGAWKDIQELEIPDWAHIRQQELSVIFQDLRLFLELSALENIQLKNQLTDYQTAAQIQDMATALQIEHLLQQPCGQLSYGQRQRVAIIRALCQPFQFLIMDEPFAHLDSANIKRCCELIATACTTQSAGFAIASLEASYDFEYDQYLKL